MNTLQTEAVVVLEADKRPLRPDEPQKWSATFLDETVVSRSRDPEHDACRALMARGITGKVTFVHKAIGAAGLTMDIEKGAGLSVEEGSKDGRPRVRKYRPFPTTVSSPASVSPFNSEVVREAAQ